MGAVSDLSSPGAERARHWDKAYENRGERGVSWFQSVPEVSLELIEVLNTPRDGVVIDVGGGASSLVDRLVERGFGDLSVLDVSKAALAVTRERLRDSSRVTFFEEDVLKWRPERRFDLWHDRAVFHFLVDVRDRDKYLATLRSAIRPGGGVIIGTFAPDGPEFCSGLPVSRYSPDSLASVLGSSFVVVATRRELHTTPAGGIQQFAWVAARAKASKTPKDGESRE